MTASRVRIGSAESLSIGLARTVTGCCHVPALAAGLGESVSLGGLTVEAGQSSNAKATPTAGAYSGALDFILENACGQLASGSSVSPSRVRAVTGSCELRLLRIDGSESTI